MRASEQLQSGENTLHGGVLPALTHLERAVRRVHDRWPSVKPEPPPNERNALALEMLGRVERSDWSGVSTWRVTAGAVAAFDEKRRDSEALAPLRAFYLREIEATKQQPILDGLFWVYVESYCPGAKSYQAPRSGPKPTCKRVRRPDQSFVGQLRPPAQPHQGGRFDRQPDG